MSKLQTLFWAAVAVAALVTLLDATSQGAVVVGTLGTAGALAPAALGRCR